VELDQGRTSGTTANPIQPSEFRAWCDIHQVNDLELIAELWHTTRSLDMQRLKLASEERVDK
jgi:hypothetical protein